MSRTVGTTPDAHFYYVGGVQMGSVSKSGTRAYGYQRPADGRFASDVPAAAAMPLGHLPDRH